MKTTHPADSLRPITGVALAAALLGGLSCAIKGSDAFTFDGLGASDGIVAYVNGIPGGSLVTVEAVSGVMRDHVATDQGYRFAPLAGGLYAVSVEVPAGYTCDKSTVTVGLIEGGGDAIVTFNCSPTPGTVVFTATGLTGSATYGITLEGGTTLTGQFGSGGKTFTAVPAGHWNWSLGATAGYTCTPNNGAFDLAAGATFTQAIDCLSDTGSLSVAVTGTGTTHAVDYTGPQSGTVQAGETPVIVSVLPGNYTLSFINPVGYTCPTSVQVLVPAGGTGTGVFGCTANPGTVDVSVTGTSATVTYTGASSGSVVAGATPVPVTGLPAGSYAFTVTAPAGFTCMPMSVPVTLAPGGTENAAFTLHGGGRQRLHPRLHGALQSRHRHRGTDRQPAPRWVSRGHLSGRSGRSRQQLLRVVALPVRVRCRQLVDLPELQRRRSQLPTHPPGLLCHDWLQRGKLHRRDLPRRLAADAWHGHAQQWASLFLGRCSRRDHRLPHPRQRRRLLRCQRPGDQWGDMVTAIRGVIVRES